MYFLSYKWELMSWPSLIQHRLTQKPNANVAICEEHQIRWSLGMAGKPALLYKRPVMWHLLMLSTKLSILAGTAYQGERGSGLEEAEEAEWSPSPNQSIQGPSPSLLPSRCPSSGHRSLASLFMMLPDPHLSGNSKYKLYSDEVLAQLSLQTRHDKCRILLQNQK